MRLAGQAVTNNDRANQAQRGLDAYKEGWCDNGIQSDAQDLVCDLLHLVRAAGGKPGQILWRALYNFQEEEAGR